MEKKYIIYSSAVILIIVVIVAAVQINYLNIKANNLEEKVVQLESEISQKTELIESLTQKIEDNEIIISELETSLSDSELKNDEYLERIYLLNTTLMILGGDVNILDQLVGSIGPEEISVVLRAYGEKTLELDNLRRDYEELLIEYNYLLKQNSK